MASVSAKDELETTEMTFHADTLFAALFQEAIKLGKEKNLS